MLERGELGWVKSRVERNVLRAHGEPNYRPPHPPPEILSGFFEPWACRLRQTAPRLGIVRLRHRAGRDVVAEWGGVQSERIRGKDG